MAKFRSALHPCGKSHIILRIAIQVGSVCNQIKVAPAPINLIPLITSSTTPHSINYLIQINITNTHLRTRWKYKPSRSINRYPYSARRTHSLIIKYAWRMLTLQGNQRVQKNQRVKDQRRRIKKHQCHHHHLNQGECVTRSKFNATCPFLGW